MRELLKLQLPADIDRMLVVPPPEAVDFGRQRLLLAAEVGRHMYHQLKDVAMGRAVLPPKIGLSQSAMLAQVCFVLGSYYDAAVRRILSAKRLPRGIAAPAGWGDREIVRAPIATPPAETMLRVFLMNYVLAWTGLYFYRLLRHLPMPKAAMEQSSWITATSVESMWAVVRNANQEWRPLFEKMFESILAAGSELYEHEFHQVELSPRARWSLEPAELSLLAARDPRMIKKYGAKRIERVFEQQLALLMQSLGYVVIPGRIGKRTVDLICLSGAGERVGFLLEAKTTSRPYGMPTDDERALGEYVATIQRFLPTLPYVRLVLVVGPAAARNLEQRLRKAEAVLHVPLRFCSATAIVRLSSSSPGPVAMTDVVECAISSATSVLSDDFAKSAVDRYNATQEAHRKMVASLLPGS